MTESVRRNPADSSVLEDEIFHLQIDAGIGARFHEVHRAYLALAGRSTRPDEAPKSTQPGYRSVVGCSVAERSLLKSDT